LRSFGQSTWGGVYTGEPVFNPAEGVFGHATEKGISRSGDRLAALESGPTLSVNNLLAFAGFHADTDAGSVCIEPRATASGIHD